MANYFSSKTFLCQRSQQTFQQTQLVEHFISCCKLYSYQIWSAHNRSNLCPRQSLVFLIHSYWWVKDKSIHQYKATLPFLGNFAISRLLCRFKTTLSPMQTQRLQGQIWSQQIRPVSKAISCIFDSPLLLSERQINPTMQGDFATNVKQFCHQCKLKDSRVIPGHPWSFPLIHSYWS